LNLHQQKILALGNKENPGGTVEQFLTRKLTEEQLNNSIIISHFTSFMQTCDLMNATSIILIIINY